MARRVYSEVANSYSPYAAAVLQGLGAPGVNRDGWPKGRSYVGIAHFRAPYDEFGYFQDNTLQGLGMNSPVKNSYVASGTLRGAGIGAVDPSEMDALSTNAPGAVKRFILSGEPVPTLRSNVAVSFNQIHPYVYGAIAAVALGTSYVSYKRWKKTRGSAG